MKHIKTFEQLNEGLGTNDLKKEFDIKLKEIFETSKTIIVDYYKSDVLKAIYTEKPELWKKFKDYFDLAAKAQKLVKKVKSKGLSKDSKKAMKQVKSLNEFSASLKEGLDNLKTFKKKAEKGLETKEGLVNIVGNTLRNILTGKWITNVLSMVKTNLVDSYNDISTVQDVFDIKDY